MEFRVLGPLEVDTPDGPAPIGGPKQRTVLALLVLSADRVVIATRLIDALWGDDPPETARNTLQTYVRHLRKALGAERIEHRSSGYVLVAEDDEIDHRRFERLVAEARRLTPEDPQRAVAVYGEALELWRGPVLDDLADQPALQADITRLEESRMTALEDRIAVDLARGRHRELVAELEVLVRRHPFRERLWGHLIVALYRSGRQGDALESYRRARAVLVEELGIDPSTEPAAPGGTDPPPGPRPGARGRAAPRVPVARADRRGCLRARLPGAAGPGRPGRGGEGDPSRSRQRPGLRAGVRARGATDRTPGAPAHRPAVRLLARP
jgi:DNA-binding SARP family transcriptional activator